jgi:hypothetical protein
MGIEPLLKILHWPASSYILSFQQETKCAHVILVRHHVESSQYMQYLVAQKSRQVRQHVNVNAVE